MVTFYTNYQIMTMKYQPIRMFLFEKKDLFIKKKDLFIGVKDFFIEKKDLFFWGKRPLY